MIILTNSTDKITAKLGGAVTTNQMRTFASYRDTTTTSITPGRNATTTNGATSIDIVGAPVASTQRIIDYISVFNNDTVNQTLSIYFSDNGTLYELFVATLAPQEKVEFQEGQGWRVMTTAGSVKTSLNQGNNPISSTMQVVTLGSDQVNNNATANTMQDVTGLSFAVTAGNRYYFKFVINYSSAATTTGSRWSINGPSLTTTTSTRNATVVGYDLPAASSASSAQLLGNNAIIEGYIIPAADGTVIARFASEVLSSAITAKAGSVLYWQQL